MPPRGFQGSRLDLRGVKVLVVEDHDDSRDAMRAMIEFLGGSARVARNGNEALEAVSQGKPDVVLCDVVMPDMDGFELLRRLRMNTRLRQLPVIALTGLASHQDVLRTCEAGFSGHLVKPIDLQALAAQLHRFVGARRGRGSG